MTHAFYIVTFVYEWFYAFNASRVVVGISTVKNFLLQYPIEKTKVYLKSAPHHILKLIITLELRLRLGLWLVLVLVCGITTANRLSKVVNVECKNKMWCTFQIGSKNQNLWGHIITHNIFLIFYFYFFKVSLLVWYCFYVFIVFHCMVLLCSLALCVYLYVGLLYIDIVYCTTALHCIFVCGCQLA